MVSKVLGLLNKSVGGLHETALVLIVSSLGSQILALLRDRLLAHTFGASRALDVYYASFRVPDFLFVTVASLVSITIVIPFLAQKLSRGDKETHEFLNSLFTLFLLAIGVVAAVTFFLMPVLSHVVAPGFASADRSEFITLSRLLLLSPILLGVSNLFGSVSQTFKKFVVYALTPIFYNVGIIIGIIFLVPTFGLYGLAFGVILGALLQIIIQLPSVVDLGFIPRLVRRINFAHLRELLVLCVPRMVALSASQLVMIAVTALASFMREGSVTVFTFSQNVGTIILAIGVSYSLAAFADLSKHYVEGKKEEFFALITSAARNIIFWSIPATALFIVLRAQIIRSIFGSGRFDWTSTRLVAASLALFVFSVVAQGLVQLLIRGYHAIGRTARPLLINFFCSLLIIVSALFFIHLFGANASFRFFIEALFRVEDIPGTVVLMLPLAFSFGMLVNAILLVAYFRNEYPEFISRIRTTFWHSLYASIIMGFVAYQGLVVFARVLDLTTFWGIFLQGFFAGIAGILAGIVILTALGNVELAEFWTALHKKFWKTKPIIPGPEELHP